MQCDSASSEVCLILTELLHGSFQPFLQFNVSFGHTGLGPAQPPLWSPRQKVTCVKTRSEYYPSATRGDVCVPTGQRNQSCLQRQPSNQRQSSATKRGAVSSELRCLLPGTHRQ